MSLSSRTPRSKRKRVVKPSPPKLPRIRSDDIVFGRLPYDICKSPSDHSLSAFELLILGTIISAAGMASVELRHEARLAAGKQSIAQERANQKTYAEKWERVRERRAKGAKLRAPVREYVTGKQSRRPMPVEKAIKIAGKFGYDIERKWQSAGYSLGPVTVSATYRSLIWGTGYVPGSKRQESLKKALRTLSQPIIVAGKEREPPLAVEYLDDGSLAITVSAWCLSPPYKRFVLPLPTKSELATKLLLWLTVIQPGYEDREESGITWKRFFALFGFPNSMTASRRKEKIDRALGVLNVYLRDVVGETGSEQLTDYKLFAPASIRIIDLDGGRMRVVKDDAFKTRKRGRPPRSWIARIDRLQEPKPFEMTFELEAEFHRECKDDGFNLDALDVDADDLDDEGRREQRKLSKELASRRNAFIKSRQEAV